MCCPLIEGFGMTETTGTGFVTESDDPKPGHVGGPNVTLEYRLEDIPEMKYMTDDKDKNGNPMPRGEICLRGSGITQGYYKDLEKTKETIDKGNWLHTGDVGQINLNGSVKIIDRKKNIFKLS